MTLPLSYRAVSTTGNRINISPTIVIVAEGGANDTYQVCLRGLATDPVPTAAITVTPSPDSEVTVSPPTVVFTPGVDTNVTKTVTVTAVDDAVIEGLHSGAILNNSISADGNYNLALATVTANITDNDSGIVIIKDTVPDGPQDFAYSTTGGLRLRPLM